MLINCVMPAPIIINCVCLFVYLCCLFVYQDNKRSITQFHFTVWPDFGVPQEASAMLKFVRHVRRYVTPTQGPMLVHCSAGVGRTGTFIAIDILLQRMQEVGGVINVQEVVCRMRAQRGNMVQTPVRIEFLCNKPFTNFFLVNPLPTFGQPFTDFFFVCRLSICSYMTPCYMLTSMGSLKSMEKTCRVT